MGRVVFCPSFFYIGADTSHSKSKMDHRTQFESLLSVLRPTNDDSSFAKSISHEDWSGIVDLSLQHGIGPLMLYRLREKNLEQLAPAETLKKLQSATLHTGFKNTKLYHELANVLKGFNQESIPTIVLKGAHLAELVYPNISLRLMDDIDLLVKKPDLQRTEQKLFALGYTHLAADAARMKSTTPHHLTPFRKNGCTPIEVHWTLPSMGAFENDDGEIWARAHTATIGGCDARVLSPEDLLLHVCIHASLHHRFGLGLRPLADVAAIADRYGDVLDWNKVRAYAGEWRFITGVYLTLQLAKESVGAKISDAILLAMRPSDFNNKLTEWAKEQIFTRNTELGDSSAMSPRLAQFMGSPSLIEKIRLLFRLAFPSREDMARTSGVPLHSTRLILSYPRHWKDILFLRGGVVWRLFIRDKETIEKAEMYQKLMDKPQRS